MSTPAREGVSFVVPVHNGAAFLQGVLDAIARQADGRPMEIVVVDDGSRDLTPEILERCRHSVAMFGRPADVSAREPENPAHDWCWRCGCAQRGHPSLGVSHRVSGRSGRVPAAWWMQRLTEALQDRRFAAAQGYYEHDPAASFLARVMNRDLEQRYGSLRSARGAAREGRRDARHDSRRDAESDHVCTGNVAYRADALTPSDSSTSRWATDTTTTSAIACARRAMP